VTFYNRCRILENPIIELKSLKSPSVPLFQRGRTVEEAEFKSPAVQVFPKGEDLRGKRPNNKILE
jgi:hypothetical protein